ncbi:hypothetical protein JST97_12310 [bacterium]|nr:hypothetical protein [bacterium]
MARKMEQRLSYCLAHQDRPTDTRCAACLKPICEECTLTTEVGKFCGNECYEKRLQSNERIKVLKEEEERDRIPRMMRMLTGWALKILVLVALYFVFQTLPVAWKAWLTKSFKGLWKTVKSAFK